MRLATTLRPATTQTLRQAVSAVTARGYLNLMYVILREVGVRKFFPTNDTMNLPPSPSILVMVRTEWIDIYCTT